MPTSTPPVKESEGKRKGKEREGKRKERGRKGDATLIRKGEGKGTLPLLWPRPIVNLKG
jgi:hypothetical protein